MTTLILDKKKLKKKSFKGEKELDFIINFTWRVRKLSPKELIKKYNLDEKHTWKKIDITKEVNSIAYNV
jgi:hypothetical protein